ncbi:MAG: replication initiator protein A [Actinobacteria bacterium]|nr:replication initiator protein A [Actinomycetota bacterium]
MNNREINRKNISKKPGLSSSNPNGYSNNKEYNSIPLNRFYTASEEVTLRFYQVPKALFKNPVYKGLGLGPKLMYSILRDRLDLSIKNNWKDEKGYIYLIFSREDLSGLLEINKETATTYKRKLVKYKLIIDKRMGQGNSNRIYVLKPEIKEFLKTENPSSRRRKKSPLEDGKSHPNDTYVNEPNLNNVNRAGSEEVVENSGGEIKENTAENKEDINDIRRKIKESLKEKGKCNFIEFKDSGKESKLLEKNAEPKSKYSKNSVLEEYPGPNKYRSREKELLAREIAEVLEDDHSLGAFRAVVDKISEQQIRIFLSIIKDTYLTGKIKKNMGAMFISLAKAYAGKNNINLNFK